MGGPLTGGLAIGSAYFAVRSKTRTTDIPATIASRTATIHQSPQRLRLVCGRRGGGSRPGDGASMRPVYHAGKRVLPLKARLKPVASSGD